MKKEEMIATMSNRIEGMNEEGVKFFFDLMMIIPEKERWMASTTPERIAELDALKEKQELEEKQEKERKQAEADQKYTDRRNQAYHNHAKVFDAANTVDIPSRYDIGTDEIQAIDCVCGEVSRMFPDYMLKAAHYFFCYGFAQGSRYAKNQAKKGNKKRKPLNCNSMTS